MECALVAFSISIVVACMITALMHDYITAGHHTVVATAAAAHRSHETARYRVRVCECPVKTECISG